MDSTPLNTAKKPQSLVHIGSEARDALEAIGATMTPPCRWQDLARSVLKNFIGSQVHVEILGRARLRLITDAQVGDALVDAARGRDAK
jgi:hypothetical protein